jgi:hypothetical protein
MIRKLATHLLALLTAVVGADIAAQSAAQPPLRQHALPGSGAKPPWLWSIEERIAKRVDPAERAARRARALAKARHIAPGWSLIDGTAEPELFLPVELVTQLVMNTDAPDERWRETYRAAIESHGWSFDRFWEVIDSGAAPYLSLMQQAVAQPGKPSGDVDRAELSRLVCAASADLLEAAYEAFGTQAFDEFLYGNVAPRLRRATADRADTADVLRHRQKGCR